MIELSNERIDEIIHQETPAAEEMSTILRSIYTRYMFLYERYFADIDALDDDKIAELNKYHKETRALIKHYYMDIPVDVPSDLKEFDDNYSCRLLGPSWHNYLSKNYDEFKSENAGKGKNEESLKAEFADHVLTGFYEEMDNIFRDAFGTNSKDTERVINGFTGILFGEEE
ncbi:MAG: hypothetical protein J6O55_01980 [Lachnospiraceae bacterium]|nr:hypothetical protein [Lachnospiraceae bacterium]